ncbi:MAG TPA: GspH/FimT family pseudopilin [Nocardioides sp.]
MIHHRPTPGDGDAGFTLVEVLITMVLMGVMMAVAVAGWNSWASAREQSGTAQEITSYLRQAQQRAVTEGRAMCVDFDLAKSEWSLYRGRCDGTDRTLLEGPIPTDSDKVDIASASFTSTASGQHGVTFTARGTATPGTVRITRSGTDKAYVIHVEGLTGRVSIS